jgi:hypothetical protein
LRRQLGQADHAHGHRIEQLVYGHFTLGIGGHKHQQAAAARQWGHGTQGSHGGQIDLAQQRHRPAFVPGPGLAGRQMRQAIELAEAAAALGHLQAIARPMQRSPGRWVGRACAGRTAT